jgi:hypothetical protein
VVESLSRLQQVLALEGAQDITAVSLAFDPGNTGLVRFKGGTVHQPAKRPRTRQFSRREPFRSGPDNGSFVQKNG